MAKAKNEERPSLELCSMVGHASRGCVGGTDPLHIELLREGVGISPGGSVNLEAEMHADRELMSHEFHVH